MMNDELVQGLVNRNTKVFTQQNLPNFSKF